MTTGTTKLLGFSDEGRLLDHRKLKQLAILCLGVGSDGTSTCA